MFFSVIGIGVVLYGCAFTLLSLIFDCDVRLGLLQIFGKSPSKQYNKLPNVFFYIYIFKSV